ncbi:hypothetical protein AVEN_19380-1 [Araneus ventricosus]|uniref:Uncharacterized protein n=1 Tax=Araneus ventricosus TaxID=182803 RepID=A0A4Y2KD81_ARAVE|nr:hypothetical protein AVEN_19380-1 [Araneus ventricosus]
MLLNVRCCSFHAYSISLKAPKDCCFAVPSSSSDKLSSITSCYETQCNSSSVVSSWLCSSTSSSISLLSSYRPLILAKDTISLTICSTGYLLSQTPQ